MVKKLLPFVCLFLCVINGCATSQPADDILAFVRSKLPDDPVSLTGTLKVRTANGFTQSRIPVQMNLDWGAAQPTARYTIGKEKLEITWSGQTPNYHFSNAEHSPTGDILDTGFTWADLSFSVLWWPESQLVGEDRKVNRDCYVVEVPVPESDRTMRLWIEKKMGMLLEAQTLDADREPLRRMKIKSIKKMDGMWVAKDLEIKDYATGNRTTLQVTDLEWKARHPNPDIPPAE